LGIFSTGGHILRRVAALLACAVLAGALAQEARSATFGKTTVGASTSYASSDYVLASRFTLGVQSTVSKLTASLSGSGTSGLQAVRGVVYADFGGAPAALKGSTQEVQVAWNKTKGWVDLTFAAPLSLPAGDYWLCLHGGPRTGDALAWYGYDFLAAGQRSKYDAYSNGASDPFGTASSKDRSMSIYATYTQTGSTLPVSTSPPSISGTAQEGQTLTGSPGTWTGTEPISFSYRWLRCDTAGNACTPFATGSSYSLSSADVGSTLRIEVTAFNVAGSAVATSPPTSVVTAKPVSDPVIAAAGDISCDPLAWNYNGGIGSSSACHQKQVSDLLVGGNFSAVLPLGDLQYECSPLSALTQAYSPTWGRVKSISRPVLGNHEYYTDADVGSAAHTTCDNTSGSPPSGYFAYFGSAGGRADQGVLQLRHRQLARRRAELELQQSQLRHRLDPGAVAPGRPRRPSLDLHIGVPSSPALQLRRHRTGDGNPAALASALRPQRRCRPDRSRPRLRAVCAADAHGGLRRSPRRARVRRRDGWQEPLELGQGRVRKPGVQAE
jgi:hypothetical protein